LRSDLPDEGGKDLVVERDGARKIAVMGRIAGPDRGRDGDGDAAFGGVAGGGEGDGLAQVGVDHQGQVRPVLFEGADGDDRDRVAADKVADLGPAEFGKADFGHHAGPSAAIATGA
jgi:hypothetical protein